MADVRLIDANSVCKKIVESIRHAEEWANEARAQQDIHGLRCATEAKTSLLAMLARIHDEPTIEAEPVRYGKWVKSDTQRHVEITYECSECRHEAVGEYEKTPFCGGCGAIMGGDSDETD